MLLIRGSTSSRKAGGRSRVGCDAFNSGYNLTEFSDDLTEFDYDHEGFFINLVGTY
jgi:hypothetical protein